MGRDDRSAKPRGRRMPAKSALAASLAMAWGAAWAAPWADCQAPSKLAVAQRQAPSTSLWSGEAAPPTGARVEIASLSCSWQADGSSRMPLRVRVLDAEGKPASGKAMVTLETDYGRFVWPDGSAVKDADATLPGVQVEVENGYAEVALESSNASGKATVRALLGPKASEIGLFASTEKRPAIAAGLVEGTAFFGKRQEGADRPADPFEADLLGWSADAGSNALLAGRLAYFYKGPLLSTEWTATSGYDSIADPKSGTFADPRPVEGVYPIFGDAALTGSEALGPGRFWGRVEKGSDYVMFGDPRKAQKDPVLASLLKLGKPADKPEALSGKAVSDSGRAAAEGSASLDSAVSVVQEFASQGSGPYALASSGGIVGAETVEIVARDRTSPSHVVWTKALTRLADYTFEPFSGRILLVQPLPAFDSELNPESLRVSYSVDQGGPKFWSYSGAARVEPFPGVDVGAALSRDGDPLATQELGSVFGRWTSQDGRSKLEAEASHSRDDSSRSATSPFSGNGFDAPGLYGGSAWRVAGSSQSADGALGAGFAAAKAQDTFFNPSGSATPGMGSAQGSMDYKIAPHWSAKLAASATTDDQVVSGLAVAGKQAAKATIGWTEEDRWTIQAGLGYDHYGAGARRLAQAPYADSSGSQPSLANGPYGGFGLGGGLGEVNPSTGLSPTQQASGFEGAASSESALAKAQYKASSRLTLTAVGQQSVGGSTLKEYGAGADYALTDSFKLYARADWMNGLGSGFGADGQSAGRAVSIGASSKVLSEGTVFSEYRLGDSASGSDAVQASGIKNYWTPRPGLRLGAAYEELRALDDRTPSTRSIVGSAEWTGSKDWRASQKLELRRSSNFDDPTQAEAPRNQGFSSVLSESYVAVRATRDWSALARLYALRSHSDSRGDGYAARGQLGAAYRDSSTNRVNALFAYERREQRDPNSSLAGSNGVLSEIADTFSATADWHPSRPWWLTGRLAHQTRTGVYENDTPDAYSGNLAGGRATWDFTSRWDVSALASALKDGGGTQWALGGEVGRVMAANLWLGAGYNLQGFHANSSLAGSIDTARGFFIRLRFKFDERVFSGNDPHENRSLDPNER